LPTAIGGAGLASGALKCNPHAAVVLTGMVGEGFEPFGPYAKKSELMFLKRFDPPHQRPYAAADKGAQLAVVFARKAM
jgi:hypothetical protein